MTTQTWKEELEGIIDEALEREIEIFETQIALRRIGKVEEKLFAETRLRRGVYGQRYDNGQRHDGVAAQAARRTSRTELTKGPDTVWDAPGMQRIKIPFGGLTGGAARGARRPLRRNTPTAFCHVTTRQDHPAALRAPGGHTRTSCAVWRRPWASRRARRAATSVRNITGLPRWRVCAVTETFDVTPYTMALRGRSCSAIDDAQDFGRKFKVAFSGCGQRRLRSGERCTTSASSPARARSTGTEFSGASRTWVGGGLGTVPYQGEAATTSSSPRTEILPLAVRRSRRVFARLGEKKNRARARHQVPDRRSSGSTSFKRLVADGAREAIPARRALVGLHRRTSRPTARRR